MCIRDRVQSYLNRCAEKELRIRLVRPGNAVLLPVKLNWCLKEAKGKYIARMDGDDFSHPDRFQKQMNYLSKHPEISFAGCNVNLIQNGKNIGKRCFPEYQMCIRDRNMTLGFVDLKNVFYLPIKFGIHVFQTLGYIFMYRRYEPERFLPAPNPPAAAGKYLHCRPCLPRFCERFF